MADEKHADDKQAAKNTEENLTPTPTQAEMDEIMSKLSGDKKPEAKAGAEVKHATPLSDPPTLTQQENDDAMMAAAPGDDFSDPKMKEKRAVKEKEKAEAETKRKKDMEADHPAGYQTRDATKK